MLTKIGDKVGGPKEAHAAPAKPGVADKPSDSPTSRPDTVELTSGAQLIERLEKSLGSLPEIDSARVDAVKSAIASGDYRIDAEKIADALLRFEREFGA